MPNHMLAPNPVLSFLSVGSRFHRRGGGILHRLLTMQHTKSSLLLAGQKLTNRNGKPPTKKMWKASPFTPSINQVLVHFKSWKRFLLSLGYTNINTYSGGFEKEDLIGALKSVMAKRDKYLTYQEWGESPILPCGVLVTKRFGSWENFLNAAGFRNEKKDLKRELLRISGGWITPKDGEPYQWPEKRLIDSGGYIRLYNPEHPDADAKGLVIEHRFIMSEYLGRPVTKKEVVHHRNGVRADNHLSNLEIVSLGTHRGRIKCPYCSKEFAIR